ncbi:MAG TPA: phosphodiester glycosidase family protein [Gaiellaceae bacterium]|nr:phosphodiester glycosidase family protein [Gaiellaceae bacterium]
MAARSSRFRLRRWLPIVLLVCLLPAVVSWTRMALLPSSLPLGVRTVEWLRLHHFNWLVDDAEHVYYSWQAPKKGGPQLKALPAVGLAGRDRLRSRAGHAKPWPAPITPVFAHPLRGEGVWKPTGPAIDGKAPVLVTTFRTERDYPRIVAYVAWFDHTRTAVAYYPGRYEPPHASLRGPEEIPHDQRWRLLATFNSGFIYQDGLNGDALNGHVNEPLRRGLATLVAYRNGRVDVADWTGGPAPGPAIAWARQSLPLIIDRGRLSPKLDDSSAWGFTLGNAVRVWRTGVGIDRRGNLVYAAADYQTVTTLARILQRAGAVRAMELDINPEWPTLITYRHHGDLIPTRVVPNFQQPATRYLVPDDRDFFAVYRRLRGAVDVPLGGRPALGSQAGR